MAQPKSPTCWAQPFDSPSTGSGQALIQQDNGRQTRTLLADGLGSVVTLANRATSLTATAVAVAGNGQFLTVWQDRRSGNDDIYGQRLTSTGGLTGGNFVIANSSSAETAPALAWHSGANAYLVVWQRDGNVWARPFLSTDTPLNPAFAVSTASGAAPATQPAVAPIPGASTFLVAWNQWGLAMVSQILGRTVTVTGSEGDVFPIAEEPLAARGAPTLAAAGEGTHLLAWEDSRKENVDVYARLVRQERVVDTKIKYTYDPLYRLVNAEYSGILNGNYGYEYDTAGNRLQFQTNITTTQTIAYQYDAANRLVQSAELGGDTTTYEWDAAGRLLTTTVGSSVSRVYAYDQRNNLTSALVDGLLTTFVYDGDGHRRQMSVAGEVTTYALDYGGGFRVLLEEGGAFAETKHYLYGMECIAELVDAGEPESEWRYYHQDGNHLVRQTTNKAATVTLAWTYSPEGAVVLGEEGPVTHLGCEATYDWSTGLIFKSGSYFDPHTGIWITMSGMVVWNNWQPNPQRNRKQRRRRWLWLALLLLILLFTLAGCGGGGTPTPIAMNPTATCTPTTTPNPTLPVTTTPQPTIGPPNTSTPWPTITPWPSVTQPPTPSVPTPYPTDTPPSIPGIEIWSTSPIRTSGVYPDWVQWYGRTKFAQDNNYYASSGGYRPGLDLGASNVTPHDGGLGGTPVYAGTNGIVLDSKTLDTEGLGQVKISLSDGTTAWYQHLDPSSIKVSNPDPVGPDTIIGYLETTQRHVHLEKRTSTTSVENPLPYFEPGLRNILIQNHHGQYDQTTYVAGHPKHPLGQPDRTFR